MKTTISFLIFYISIFSPSVHSNDGFLKFLEEGNHGVDAYMREYVEHKQVLGKEYLDYESNIKKQWGVAVVSSPKVFVQYSEDFTTRSSVDFKMNTLSISVRDSVQVSAEKITNKIKEVISITVSKAISNSAILSDRGTGARSNSLPLIGASFSASEVKSMVAGARMSVNSDSSGKFTKVTLQLPNSATFKRAKRLLPHVERSAKEFGVDPSLIYAVIHTESSFNPLAQSHIPAFGLMQIVPSSAGRDVHKFLTGSNSEPSRQLLLHPNSNIRYGTAYLHLLDKRYLSDIKDPVSRRFCVIAAYNTGAGNVARAFTGKASVKLASKRINSMTSDQVYHHLKRNLTHKEARDYLHKVSSRIKIYG